MIASTVFMKFTEVIVEWATLLSLCATSVMQNTAVRCVRIVSICVPLPVVSTIEVITGLFEAVLLDLARLLFVIGHVQEGVFGIRSRARTACDLCNKWACVDSGCKCRHCLWGSQVMKL